MCDFGEGGGPPRDRPARKPLLATINYINKSTVIGDPLVHITTVTVNTWYSNFIMS